MAFRDEYNFTHLVNEVENLIINEIEMLSVSLVLHQSPCCSSVTCCIPTH